jgi:DNA-binding winged helix-turn-helix (wHTH) protein
VAFAFGDFVLDRDTRQLLRQQEEVHLSPKAFDLLTILLLERPRVVSKADLQQRLWPSTYVQESNVSGLIAEIRRALADTASTPRFVRTIYRIGYRFVGEVTAVPAADRQVDARVKLCLLVESRQFALMEGSNSIGRAADATITLEFRGVSRYHARILVAGAEATLEDLGSKNGTYLNGVRIATPQRLADGNEIRLGAMSATFRVGLPTAATETVTTRIR